MIYIYLFIYIIYPNIAARLGAIRELKQLNWNKSRIKRGDIKFIYFFCLFLPQKWYLINVRRPGWKKYIDCLRDPRLSLPCFRDIQGGRGGGLSDSCTFDLRAVDQTSRSSSRASPVARKTSPALLTGLSLPTNRAVLLSVCLDNTVCVIVCVIVWIVLRRAGNCTLLRGASRGVRVIVCCI